MLGRVLDAGATAMDLESCLCFMDQLEFSLSGIDLLVELLMRVSPRWPRSRTACLVQKRWSEGVQLTRSTMQLSTTLANKVSSDGGTTRSRKDVRDEQGIGKVGRSPSGLCRLVVQPQCTGSNGTMGASTVSAITQ